MHMENEAIDPTDNTRNDMFKQISYSLLRFIINDGWRSVPKENDFEQRFQKIPAIKFINWNKYLGVIPPE